MCVCVSVQMYRLEGDTGNLSSLFIAFLTFCLETESLSEPGAYTVSFRFPPISSPSVLGLKS